MPETVSGSSSDPGRDYSGQGIKDTLARLEAKIDRLAEQMADAEAEAEEIMRRATSPATPTSPRHRTRSPRRRGDTVLRVVALMAPRHLREQQYTPRCTAACARPAAHQAPHKTGG